MPTNDLPGDCLLALSSASTLQSLEIGVGVGQMVGDAMLFMSPKFAGLSQDSMGGRQKGECGLTVDASVRGDSSGNVFSCVTSSWSGTALSDDVEDP